MDRKKYIVEASDDVKKVIALGVTHGGAIWTDTTDIENLEELNSDYINEHFGDLQDTIYKKGLHDGESKCRYCNEYQRGLDDAWEAARKVTFNSDDGGLSIDELDEIFGCYSLQRVFRAYSAQQTIAKLKAYEEQKADDEIKVENERMEAKRVMHEDCAFLYWTCGNCNSLVLEHDNFCSNCGADFRRNEDGKEKNNDEN